MPLALPAIVPRSRSSEKDTECDCTGVNLELFGRGRIPESSAHLECDPPTDCPGGHPADKLAWRRIAALRVGKQGVRSRGKRRVHQKGDDGRDVREPRHGADEKWNEDECREVKKILRIFKPSTEVPHFPALGSTDTTSNRVIPRAYRIEHI